MIDNLVTNEETNVESNESSPEVMVANSPLNPESPEFVPESVDVSADELLDPAEETFPYEETDALNFTDSWFEEEETEDADEELDNDSDSEELRRSSRIRKPAKRTTMEKLGGTPVLRELKRLIKRPKR